MQIAEKQPREPYSNQKNLRPAKESQAAGTFNHNSN